MSFRLVNSSLHVLVIAGLLVLVSENSFGGKNNGGSQGASGAGGGGERRETPIALRHARKRLGMVRGPVCFLLRVDTLSGSNRAEGG
jgi:hypothetical protein